MQIFHPDIIWKIFPQYFRIAYDIRRFEILILLYHRTDHIALMSLMHLFRQKTICIRTVFPSNHTVFNRLPSHRKLIDNGNIQIAIQNNGKSSRNRCRTHNHNMRIQTFIRKLFPLLYPKPVLFIRDNQCQVVISHRILNDRMCSDNDIRNSQFNSFISLPLFFRFHGTGQ
ncbi:unknown [Roseburia sp. CAG:303]|nr:unknown [Roseburia sp. CAG:303]